MFVSIYCSTGMNDKDAIDKHRSNIYLHLDFVCRLAPHLTFRALEKDADVGIGDEYLRGYMYGR